MRHAQLFVSARFDGNGVVKAAPKAAITRLFFIGLRHFEALERHDARHAAAVEQCLAVRAIVKEKYLTVITLAEVAAQHGQYAVFRFDFCAEHTVKVGKAGKAAKLLDLARQMPHSLEQRKISLITQTREQRCALAVEFDNETVNGHLLVGKAGKERAVQERADIGAPSVKAAVDTLRVRAVGHDCTDLK